MDAHAYSLISANVITLDNGKKERLIQIRNPYGRKEWKGDWGDKSSKWTANTASQVDYERKDDGCFWICFRDYMKFFFRTTICYYDDAIEDNYVEDQHDLYSFGITKFELTEDHNEPLVVSIDQINSRFVDENMQGDYMYPTIKLVLTKLASKTEPETQNKRIK